MFRRWWSRLESERQSQLEEKKASAAVPREELAQLLSTLAE